jgi:rhamnogalacturonan endolyase
LQTLPGDTPNDAAVGDLDGDGEYEIIVKQEQRGRDNSQKGATGQTKLEAYKLDGTLLWRIDLGRNVREGAHYTQFLVYDLDGDGRAEVMCRTADGTTDGTGTVIGDKAADHRNRDGYVLTGPEFLTVFDGLTGKALATVDYVPARGRVADWGDAYGNRVDRFLAGVAYLDGARPSAVFCRGYYTRSVIAAWDWRGGKLTPTWTATAGTTSSTARWPSVPTAGGCTRRASATATPCTSPTSTPPGRGWRCLTSTSTPRAPACRSATPGRGR